MERKGLTTLIEVNGQYFETDNIMMNMKHIENRL